METPQNYPEATVGALIFDPAGRLLLMQSHKWGGMYVVPGGHAELGETLETALRREVMEETGLAVHDISFIGFQEFIFDLAYWKRRHFVFFDYACHTDTTEVHLNHEAEAYLWVTPEEALRLPIQPYAGKSIRTYLALQAAGVRRAPVESAAVQLILAGPEKQPVLANLLELYLHDFSEYDDADVRSDGRYGYGYLDCYWSEPGRYPFLIQVDGKLAGFALVRTLEAGEVPLYSMAEFCVLRKYRRQGVGRSAAVQLFDRFPGRWEVNQEAANLPSQSFWRRVIGDYTGGHFVESWQMNEGIAGPVQRFGGEQR
jgi:predicted acetyltransferase/8-oxo-dGTP pyrophosphatase MutT (NUDIX family)